MTSVRHASIIGRMTEHPDFATVPVVTLGWRLQMALAQGGLKHKDLVERFEVSRETVSRWCRDIGAAPKKFILNEIAVMCGVSPRWLIDGVAPHQPDPDGDDILCARRDSNPQPSDPGLQAVSPGVVVPLRPRRQLPRGPEREERSA